MEFAERRVHLKRIGVFSTGGMFAAIYGTFGFIGGIFISLIALLGTSLGGFVFGIGAVIFLPIIYGIVGFLGGLLMALIYNWAAKLTGGIEMEFGTS